jgi:hypothetical protein
MRKAVMMLMVCAISAAAWADFATTPHIAGEFNNWNPGANMMTETAPGSGIWQYTITGLAPGQGQEFKITQGNWDSNWPEQNSWYTADANGEVTVTFNANSISDGWLPAQYRLGLSTDPGSWTLVGDYMSAIGRGNWNNADPTQLMTPLGRGIYVITQTLPAGIYNLKPTVTGTWDAIGPTRGRCKDADNSVVTLASETEVTVYVDALNGRMGFGDVDISFLFQAYNPEPANGAVVGTTTATLSWANPDPRNPGDTITCDVYFLDAGTSKLTSDPNMGPLAADPGVVQIANGITGQTVTLPASVLPLQDDHFYYWAVHATDPNAPGNPVTTQGDAWYFFTGDSVPVPSKPADQYMWLAQDDSAIPGGDGPSNIRYFQVTASYTDDAKSPIVDVNMVNLNWDWAKGELGIAEVSEVHDPVAKTVTAVYRTIYEEGGDPANTTVLPGYWQIRLEVTDATGTARGPVGIFRVFETCGQAAEADPDDSFDGHFDMNDDCIVNLADFADFAAAWLKQSSKYE